MNIKRVPQKKPENSLPRIGGEHYQTDGFSIDFHPKGVHEFHFTTPTEIIALPVGQPTQVFRSYDSDVLKPDIITSGILSFIQKGSTVYTQVLADQRGMRLIALNFDSLLREEIQESMSIPTTPLATGHYHSTVNTNMLSHMLQQFISGGFQGGKLVAESLLTLVIAEAITMPKSTATPETKGPLLGKVQLKQILEYIDTNLYENIGLKDLANIANLSSFHFSRCFKNATGLSPYAYLLSQRIERACQLLNYTSKSLAQIATCCGFTSQSHFSMLFKKHKGVTPLKYRMEARR